MWKNLYVAGDTGSEGGIVIYDEEYKNSCRITLEKCPEYCAVTCGIYGSMVHTAFCDLNNYDVLYLQMKNELQDFIDKKTSEDEEIEFYRYFTDKY